MKVLHVTRNIPIKNLGGNRVIWDVMDNNKRFCREQKVIFPAEYIPKLPFQPERYKVFSELKGYIVERGYEVLFSNYIRIPGKHAFSFSNIPINKNEVIEYSNGFDCVHAHYIMPDGHLARELCKIKKIPYIVSVRQGDLDRLEKIKKHTWLYKKYKKIVDDASAVIAINEKIHNYLKNEFGIVSVLIPHGINKEIIEKKDNSKSKKIRVICAGQYIKRKNIDWVIGLANKFLDNKRIQFTIVGSGPLKDKYVKKSSGAVEFLDWLPRDELLKEFNKSDIFILPSDNETFGMVYIEAAAKNCLIIGKKGTGLDGYFSSGEDAYFIESEEELYDVFRTKILDKECWKDIAHKGFLKVNENFVWEVVSEKYRDLYMRVCYK